MGLNKSFSYQAAELLELRGENSLLNKSFSYQAAELLELRGENSLLLIIFNQVAFSLTQGTWNRALPPAAGS